MHCPSVAGVELQLRGQALHAQGPVTRQQVHPQAQRAQSGHRGGGVGAQGLVEVKTHPGLAFSAEPQVQAVVGRIGRTSRADKGRRAQAPELPLHIAAFHALPRPLAHLMPGEA